MDWIKQIVTGKDNKTHDVIRWGAVLGILQALGLSAYDVIAHNAHFDLQAYGVGLGALFAAVGAALGMKKDTEP